MLEFGWFQRAQRERAANNCAQLTVRTAGARVLALAACTSPVFAPDQLDGGRDAGELEDDASNDCEQLNPAAFELSPEPPVTDRREPKI